MAKDPKIMQQYGVRWSTGVVFPYSSRSAAEEALTEARARGRDGALVVHEGVPGRPSSEWTAWTEVEEGRSGA